MLNMIDTQDKLKNFSEGQLIQEMQRPSGSAPQFMVLGEIERRKRIRADAQKQEGLMQPTVAQEAVSAAGVPQQGIAQVAQSLAPKTDMTQNTGVPNVQAAGLPAQPNQPQRMAGGGIMRLAPGGKMSEDVYNLSVNYPHIYEQYKNDPEMLAQMALALGSQYETRLNPNGDAAFQTKITTPEKTGLEELELERSNDILKKWFTDPTNRELGKQADMDAMNFGEDYDFAQRAETQRNLRGYDANDPIFAEGSVVETAPNVSADALADGTADPNAQGSAGFQRKTKSKEAIRAEELRRAQEQSMPNSYTSLSEQAAEQARQAYLAGGYYNEGGIPAITNMLDRSREFQQSDTYTPPGQIYTDILDDKGNFIQANSPLSLREKYENDDDTTNEAEMFAEYSNRLSIERGIANDIKEQEAFARAKNAKRIAGDAMDEDVVMGQSLTGPGFVQRLDNAVKTTFGAEDPAVAFNKFLYETNQAKAKAEAEAKAKAEAEPARLREASMINKSGLASVASKKKILPAGGEGGGEGGGDAKQTFKSTAQNMNQDKWLALAQAGLTLMGTGDFAKAGSAGLAAYANSKKTDLAERKIASDEKLTDARIAAANKTASGIKAPAAAALSFYQKQIDSAQDALANAKTTIEKTTASRKLTKAQNALRQLVDRYELSMGMFSSGRSSDGVIRNDLTKVG